MLMYSFMSDCHEYYYRQSIYNIITNEMPLIEYIIHA